MLGAVKLIILLSLGLASASTCKDNWVQPTFKVDKKNYDCEFTIEYDSDGVVNMKKSSAECTTNCKKNCQVIDQTVTSECGSEISVSFTISKKGQTTLEDATILKIGMDCSCYEPPTTTTTTTTSASASTCEDNWVQPPIIVNDKNFDCEFTIQYDSDGVVNMEKSSAECTTNENCKKNCQVTGLATSDCGSEIFVTFTINKKGKTTLEDATVSKIGMDCPCYVPTTTEPIQGKGAKCTNPKGWENDPSGTYYDGCTKYTCIQAKGNNGIWVDSQDCDRCCFHKGTGYEMGEVIEVTYTPCIETSLVCERVDDMATIVAKPVVTCFQEILEEVQENGEKIDEIFDELIDIFDSSDNEGVPGLIITGGSQGEPDMPVGKNVEVFNLQTKTSCRLNDLPGVWRLKHSHCGGLLCGGFNDPTHETCLKFNPLTGDFDTTPVILQEMRLRHLCWDVEGEDGILLVGGMDDAKMTTEYVCADGSSSAPSFNLTTQTEEACGIKTQDNKFVITGGLDHSLADDALTRVTRYSRTGETETLADLNVGRFYHACGSYLTDQGEEVLLVTGGAEYAQGHFVHGWDDLASTEVLEDAAGAWRLTNPLPSVRKGLVAASVMNTIYVMGGHPHGGAYINDILQYNTEDHTWEMVGFMMEGRINHAVAVLDDVSQLCPETEITDTPLADPVANRAVESLSIVEIDEFFDF